MKRLATLSRLVLLAVLVSSCNNRRFVATDFEETTANHLRVAVLPFEVVYTGKIPKGMTDEDIADAALRESKAFQVSFHQEVLAASTRGRRAYRVDLQDYRITLNRFREAGLDISAAWEESPDELARILEVDAVVLGRVQTRRLLSNLESMGVDIGRRILNRIGDDGIIPGIGRDVANTHDMFVNYNIVEADNGLTLWSFSCPADANWQDQPQEVMERVNRRAARNFPYRYSTAP